MLFTKYCNEAWLLLITAMNQGGLILVMMYCLNVIDDFTVGYHTAKQCCARLNVWEVVRMLFQGYSAFLLALQGHYYLIVFDCLQLGWRIFKLFKNMILTGDGIYVENDIVEPGATNEHRYSYNRYMAYYGIMLTICYMRVQDYVQFNATIDIWYPMWDTSIFETAVIYLTVTACLYAIIAVVAYTLSALPDLEVMEEPNLLMMCKKMNLLTVVKILIRSAASCILLGFGSFVAGCMNFCAICYEFYEGTHTRVTTIGLFDPNKVKEPEEIPKLRTLYKLYLGHSVLVLYVFSYLLLKEVYVPWLFDFAHIDRIALLCGGLMISPSLSARIGVAAFRYMDKTDVNIKYFCMGMKAALYIVTIFHFHVCGFFFAYGQYALVIVNLPLLYMEIDSMLGDLYPVADMRDNKTLFKYYKRAIFSANVYVGYALFYATYLDIEYTGPSAMEVVTSWFKFHRDLILMVTRNITIKY